MKNVAVGIISRKNPQDTVEYLFISSTNDFGKYTGLLYPPGGHIEEGETIEEGLMREIYEELGFILAVVRKISTSDSDINNQTTHWYECKQIPENTEFVIDEDEIQTVKWLSKDKILSNENLFWPKTFEFMEKYLQEK